MHLPKPLVEAISELSYGISLKELSKEVSLLREAYLKANKQSLMLSPLQKIAYLHTRLPATYAVAYEVLREALTRTREPISSLIDLGSGPGTALFAALEWFSLEKATLYEKDPKWIALHQQLQKGYDFTPTWIPSSLEKEEFPLHDLFIASYSLNEMPADKRLSLLKRVWEKTQKMGIIIEPGTPEGFKEILEIRQFFIDSHAYVIAPCTHHTPCPMDKGWCHFDARVERSSFHRQMKGGSLNFEDEKYCYLIVSKNPYTLPRARVVHPFEKQGKKIAMTVCSEQGLKKVLCDSKKIKLGSTLD